MRIAVVLRLDLPICTPHVCQQCEVRMDILAHHGLSCNKKSGKHHRHATVNNVLYRAMVSAGILGQHLACLDQMARDQMG